MKAASYLSTSITAMLLLGQWCANAIPVPISPGIVNPANGNTYYLLESSGWTEAESAAQGLGGHLATVRNQQEQDWLVSNFSAYAGQDRFLWIGLNDAMQEGTWVWASGESVAYRNWWIWEPNSLHPSEDYAQMFGVNNNQGIPAGYWNDIYDSPWPYQGAPSGHNFGPVFGIVEVTRVPDAGATILLAALACGLLLCAHHMPQLSPLRPDRLVFRESS